MNKQYWQNRVEEYSLEVKALKAQREVSTNQDERQQITSKLERALNEKAVAEEQLGNY